MGREVLLKNDNKIISQILLLSNRICMLGFHFDMFILYSSYISLQRVEFSRTVYMLG